MEIIETDFTEGKEKDIFQVIKEIILEDFPELEEQYDIILLIIAYREAFQNNKINREIERFTGKSIMSNPDPIKPAHSTATGKKGVIDVNVNEFNRRPKWNQKFIVRHECCHLLNQQVSSPTLRRLVRTYPRSMLQDLLSYRRHLRVHQMMIKRWLDDWLKKPVRLPDKPGSPPYIYRDRKKNDARDAIYYAVTRVAQVIYLSYLNEFLVCRCDLSKETRKALESDLERYGWYSDAWWECLEKEANVQLQSQREWLTLEHFDNEEVFLKQIMDLLTKMLGIS